MKYLAKLNLKRLGKKALNIVGKVADNVALGGVIQSVKDENSTPAGEIDWEKFIITLISCSIPVILLIAVLANWITVDELKQLLELF